MVQALDKPVKTQDSTDNNTAQQKSRATTKSQSEFISTAEQTGSFDPFKAALSLLDKIKGSNSSQANSGQEAASKSVDTNNSAPAKDNTTNNGTVDASKGGSNKDANPSSLHPTTETTIDHATITKGTDGFINKFEREKGQGGGQIDFNPQRGPNNEIVRAPNGQPLITSINITRDGVTKTIDLTELDKTSKSGIASKGLTLDEKSLRQDSTCINLTREDGSRCKYNFTVNKDGNLTARIADVYGPDGNKTRHYEYQNSEDPTRASGMVDYYKDNNGKPLVQVRDRIGDSDRFNLSEYQQVDDKWQLTRTEAEKNVDTRTDGQVTYERKPLDTKDLLIELMMRARLNENSKNPDTLVVNDLASAKKNLLDNFGSNRAEAEKWVDKMINLHQSRRKDGFKSATDDQLASTLKELASIKGKNVKVLTALKSLGDPKTNNNQGQVGSCALNACLFIAEMLHPNKVAKVFAQILNTGKWRGHSYSEADMSARSGRDSFNNLMTEAEANTFGFNDIYKSFRGTTDTESKKAYRSITGEALPMSKGAGKDVWFVITLGGAHAQAKWNRKVGGKIVTRLENWWNGGGGHEGDGVVG